MKSFDSGGQAAAEAARATEMSIPYRARGTTYLSGRCLLASSPGIDGVTC